MGTKSNIDGQSDTDVTVSADFNAMSDAMDKGNFDELDRLMAVEDPESPDVEETPDEPVEKEGDTPDDSTEADTPADEPGVVTPVDTEAATPAASTVKTPDELVTLKQELHKLKSEAGRVAHMQRRTTELERELRALKARAEVSTTSADGTVKPTDISKVQLDPETQKELDDLKEIDPVMARTLERIAKTAVITASTKADTAIQALVQHVQEAEDQRFFLEQKALLSEMIPQHEQIFASPQWKEWKEKLSPGRRGLAESGYADEVAQAVYAFAADMQRLQQSNTPAPVVVNTPESSVTKTRARKVEQSADVRSTAPKTTTQLNEDDYFREMYEKAAVDNHINIGK